MKSTYVLSVLLVAALAYTPRMIAQDTPTPPPVPDNQSTGQQNTTTPSPAPQTVAPATSPVPAEDDPFSDAARAQAAQQSKFPDNKKPVTLPPPNQAPPDSSPTTGTSNPPSTDVPVPASAATTPDVPVHAPDTVPAATTTAAPAVAPPAQVKDSPTAGVNPAGETPASSPTNTPATVGGFPPIPAENQNAGGPPPPQDNTPAVQPITKPVQAAGTDSTSPATPPVDTTPAVTLTPAAPNSCSNLPLPRCDTDSFQTTDTAPTPAQHPGVVLPPPVVVPPSAEPDEPMPTRDTRYDLKREGVRVDHVTQAFATEPLSRWNFIGEFLWLHTNAAPGQCGCFSLYGVAVGVDRMLTPNWDVIGRFDYSQAGNATFAQNLKLYTLQGGIKRNVRTGRRDSYFVEAMAGFASPSSNFTANNNMTFAGTAGIGADISITKKISWRVAEVGYMITTENNGGDNKEQNIKFATGIKFKFLK